MFSVEKILDKKREGRRLLYLVKWEGFEDKDATWEPVSNLGGVKELIREFEKAYELNFEVTNFGSTSTNA